MASAPVVDPFDPVADGELSGRASGPQVSVVELDFQCCPEGFGRSVIPRRQLRLIRSVISELSG